MLVSRRQSLKLALTTIAGLPLLAISTRSARAATHELQISNFAFSPANLSVAVGDTVKVTNSDNAPHTASANDGSFDTGTLRAGDSAEITLSQAGTFDYRCAFHPNMTGTITVG